MDKPKMNTNQRRRICEQLVKKMQTDMFEEYVEELMEHQSDEELLAEYEDAFQLKFKLGEGV